MPAIDPDRLKFRIDDEWTADAINNIVADREKLKRAFGNVDIFYNGYEKEYGTMSLLRRFDFEPSFITTKGLFGEDAEAPDSNLKAIEIKGCNYPVKNWKLPDITNTSLSFSFDKIRQEGTIEKISKYDGYALGVFDTNYQSRPHWVQVHNFEPIVLMYITGSGSVKLTKWLIDLINTKVNQLTQDNIGFDNTHRNNRIQPKYSDVYNLLTNKDMRLIVNGHKLSKSHYELALKMADEYWEKETWKKTLAEINQP